MLVNLLEYLCLIYFSLKRVVGGFFVWFWGTSYDWGNQRFAKMTSENIPFMNYGYKEGADPDNLSVDNALKERREQLKEALPISFQRIWCSTQLYASILSRYKGDLNQKTILEVGCGRGGGCSVVHAYCKPKRYVGLDLSTDGIKHCIESHKGEKDVDFTVGNAMELGRSLPPNCFDAVINCESAHCYPDFEKFIRGVSYVLKPGGQFIIADLNAKTEWEHIRNTFDRCGMKLIAEHNITKNVTKSLRDEVQPVLSDLIWRLGGWWEWPWLWLVNNTMLEAPKRCLEDGTIEYHMYCYQKPEAGRTVHHAS